MLEEKDVSFEGPVGCLEGRQSELLDARGVVVVCHPHPLHQGNMNNKVVTTLCQAFKNSKYITVRFNYRGVGKSAGHYDEAQGEVDDCLAVLQQCQQQWPAQPIWLAGFSFGSYIAYQAAHQFSAQGLLLIAPPVNHFSFDQGAPSCPYWVVQGDCDKVVPSAEVKAWVSAQAVPPLFEELLATDHFFHGRLVILRNHVEALLA